MRPSNHCPTAIRLARTVGVVMAIIAVGHLGCGSMPDQTSRPLITRAMPEASPVACSGTATPVESPTPTAAMAEALPPATPKAVVAETPSPTATRVPPTELPPTEMATPTPTATLTSPSPTATRVPPTELPPTETGTPTPTETPTSPSPTTTSRIAAQGGPVDPALAELANLIDQARIEAALAELIWSPELAQAAEIHAKDMADHGFVTHTGSDGSDVVTRLERAGYKPTYRGEIIAWVSGGPETAFAWWWNSELHHDTMLGAAYRDFGAGRAAHPIHAGQTYFVVVFGRR